MEGESVDAMIETGGLLYVCQTPAFFEPIHWAIGIQDI